MRHRYFAERLSHGSHSGGANCYAHFDRGRYVTIIYRLHW
jgi:hypothetical protein